MTRHGPDSKGRGKLASGIVVALLVASLLHFDATPANAVGCSSSTGPGIPAPAAVATGIPGFHAAWFGQSGYMSLCPGDSAVATVAYLNTGSLGWVAGAEAQTAFLGTSGPEPGQDMPSAIGGDGTNGSPPTGWPRFNRLAVQPAPYVGPGQVAWFQFRVRAPIVPGRYSIALRPLIEGAQWMEDYGVFWNVVVLNPDGTAPPITIGGITFNVSSTARADVYTETTITKADSASLVAVVDGDIRRVETDFGRTFTDRPVIFAFGSNATATAGGLSIGNLTPSLAVFYAVVAGGAYSSATGYTFLNWYNLSSSLPITIVRHELTHKLLQQIAGKNAEIPAWFDEGNAELEAFTVGGSAWLANRAHFTVASAAAQGPSRLIPLTELVSQVTWQARSEPLVKFQYDEAAEAARLVRQDVGIAGTVAVLDLMGRGRTFDEAFQAVTGTSTSAFALTFPARVKATVAAYPGVAVAADSPAGPGMNYVAYGFAPSASLSVTIRTPGYEPATETRVADAFGVGFSYVTAAMGWPLGTMYYVTVTDGTRTVSSSALIPSAAR